MTLITKKRKKKEKKKKTEKNCDIAKDFKLRISLEVPQKNC